MKPFLILMMLFLSSASSRGQEIARIPVDGPAVVVVERMTGGGIRVILEFPEGPTAPGPPTDPVPPTVTITAATKAAVSKIPQEYKDLVVSTLIDEVNTAILLVEDIPGPDEAFGVIAGRALFTLRGKVPNSEFITDVADSIRKGPDGVAISDRMNEFKSALESIK